MEHTNNIQVNQHIDRLIRSQSRSFSLAKIITFIMQQSFSELTLAKLEKKSLVAGHKEAMINEVSKAAVGELLNREITMYDVELIDTAWKVAYAKGLSDRNANTKLH